MKLSFFPLVMLSAYAYGFVQRDFVISFWVDPIVDPSLFLVEYQRLVAADFNTVLGGFGAISPESVAQQIHACAEAGLWCIPSSCETEVGPNPGGTCISSYPAPDASYLMGYQLSDEPPSSDFPALATWMESIASRAPGALRFINLLPNYGFPPPSDGVYEAYVDAFISIVGPDILCFDHYPLFYPGSLNDSSVDTSLAGYRRNLATIRAASLKANLTFWNFFASQPFNGRPDVSESQLRWQIFTSLAYGAKGVLYFCYWSPSGASFVWGGGIMTPQAGYGNGTADAVYGPGPHYAHAQAINSKLKSYGTTLLNSTSLFVTTVNGSGSDAVSLTALFTESRITSLGGTGSDFLTSGFNILVGFFSGVRGQQQAVLLQNQDDVYPVILAAQFAPTCTPYEISPSAAFAASPALNDAPGLGFFALYLQPGDARLLVFNC